MRCVAWYRPLTDMRYAYKIISRYYSRHELRRRFE